MKAAKSINFFELFIAKEYITSHFMDGRIQSTIKLTCKNKKSAIQIEDTAIITQNTTLMLNEKQEKMEIQRDNYYLYFTITGTAETENKIKLDDFLEQIKSDLFLFPATPADQGSKPNTPKR